MRSGCIASSLCVSLGFRLRDIPSVLDEDEGALTAVVRRHLQHVERDLERQRRLQIRLAAILWTLEQSSEPPAGQIIEIMKAMMVSVDVVEIARILGVSRQRATALTVAASDFPAPADERAGRAVWARAQVVEWAARHPQRGAAWQRPGMSDSDPNGWPTTIRRLMGRRSHKLNYGWIGDEHLLAALLDPECPGAARAALQASGLSAEVLRSTIVDRLGEPDSHWGGCFRHRTQYMLLRALLKAIELRDEQVSSEHVLLALLEAPPDCSTLALLRTAGIDATTLAGRVLAATDARQRDVGVTDGASAVSAEVHAADVARVLGVARGRVVELVATAPDFPPSQMTPAGHRVWSRPGIEGWAAAHPDCGRDSRRFDPPPPGSPGPALDGILTLAKTEAMALNHTAVLQEHLLLALLDPDCPGDTRAVLKSLGVTLSKARERYVDSMGDPFEPHDRDLVTPPATHLTLEHATCTAIEVEDDYVGAEHLLLALMQGWVRFTGWLEEISVETLHERLMANTDGMLPAQEPTPWRVLLDGASPVRVPRRERLELAASPAGHDPRRRRPWGSRVFEIPGRPWDPANGQYPVDRDGYAILTCDGQPIHTLRDEHDRPILDEDDQLIFTAMPIPAGSCVRVHLEHT